MQEKIKLLNALGEETRIKIIQVLMEREQCACALFPIVGKAQSTISQHLRILEEAGILESRRDGVNIWYRVKSKKALQIMKILEINKIENKIKC
ncbi:MAG: metalloregulator ArsR/SmtB family transcription factor [Candidatus Pacearchaeota archaeon]